MDQQEQYKVGGVTFPRPFKAVRLGHIGIWTADTEASEGKLVDDLGLHQTDRLTSKDGELLGCFTTCNADHHALVAINPDTADPERRAYFEAGTTLNQISFQVNSLREVNEAYRFFLSKGAKIQRIGRDEPGSNWAVYAYDPDGHRVELYYGMEQIGWQGKSKPASMYSHMPYQEFKLPERPEVEEVQAASDKGIDLLSGYGRDSSLPYEYDLGGVRAQRPFRVSSVGPVRLFATDLEASERFYTEIIGLTRTCELEYKGHRCVFLRAASEHHSVALFPVALRTELGMSDQTVLANFSLRVQTYEQLKNARSFLVQRGWKEFAMAEELHPGIAYAAHFMLDDIHCMQLYFEMEQFGTGPLSRDPYAEWPETLLGHAHTFAEQVRQGPLA
jgi:catechol 2,3-dioxygenase-like lactoylglutathione lyase family enzyme